MKQENIFISLLAIEICYCRRILCRNVLSQLDINISNFVRAVWLVLHSPLSCSACIIFLWDARWSWYLEIWAPNKAQLLCEHVEYSINLETWVIKPAKLGPWTWYVNTMGEYKGTYHHKGVVIKGCELITGIKFVV